MATLKGSTIASTYVQLVKRADTYSQTGTNIELMIADGTVAPTGLYLESGATTDNVGIGTATPSTLLELEAADPELLLDATSGDATLSLDSNDTGDSSIINFKVAGNTQGYIEYDFDGTPANDLMNFEVNDAKRMVITGAGSVGIGTSTPSGTLHIVQTGAFSREDDATTNNLVLSRTQSAGDDVVGGSIAFTELNSEDEIRAQIALIQTTGDKDQCGLGFYVHESSAQDDPCVEEMRIEYTGFVGMGTAEPDSRLHIKTASTSSTQAALHVECTEGGVDSGDILVWLDWSADDEVHADSRWMEFHDSDGTIGRLESSATQIDTAFTQESDIRYKDNIVDTALKGLETLNKIKVRDFEWNEKYGASKAGIKVTAGFIADELYEVYPAATKGTPGAMKDILDEDGNKTGEEIAAMGVMEGAFTRLLIKAVQELSVKVTALENA